MINKTYRLIHHALQANLLSQSISIQQILYNMNNQQSSACITYLTLASASIGFAAYTLHPLLLTLYLIVLYMPSRPELTIHPPLKVASFTFTTLVFGIINGYTYTLLIQYFGSGQAPPIYSLYLSLMTIYHYFQFQLINTFHHPTLLWQSFLIYHSKQYFLANLFSISQHIICRYLFGFSYKEQHSLMYPALFVSFVGELLRISAFFTCKNNFTHVVRFRKNSKHKLITHGIYSFFRHPSYTGYFYFSVFAQLFIGNFVSCVLFFIVLSKFFNERIEFQEQALLGFFPEYLQYKKQTHILIPLVKDPNFHQKYDPEGQSDTVQVTKRQ